MGYTRDDDRLLSVWCDAVLRGGGHSYQQCTADVVASRVYKLWSCVVHWPITGIYQSCAVYIIATCSNLSNPPLVYLYN